MQFYTLSDTEPLPLSTFSFKRYDDHLKVMSNQKPFYFKSGCLNSPTGFISDSLDNNCKFQVELNDIHVAKLTSYEQWLKDQLPDIGKYLLVEDMAKEQDIGMDNIYHSSISYGDNGNKILSLYLTSRSALFDRNKKRINTNEDNITSVSGRFKCRFIISMSNVTVFNGKFYVKPELHQLMILNQSLMPEGCIVFENEDDFLKEVENRDQGSNHFTFYEDAVCDYDPDINELLD